jgi:hypothetical protein
MMYHCHSSTKHFEGWEELSEAETLTNIKQFDAGSEKNRGFQYNALPGRYRQACASMTSTGDDARHLMTESEYAERIRVRFEVDLIQLKPWLEKYDMIILSNILHMHSPEEATAILEKVDGLVKDSTLIYIHTKTNRGKHRYSPEYICAHAQVCRAFADRWKLRKEVGILDEEGQHTTYTNL